MSVCKIPYFCSCVAEIESVASTASSRSQSPEDPASLPTVHTTRSHATRSSDRHQEKPAETERKVEKELEKDGKRLLVAYRTCNM